MTDKGTYRNSGAAFVTGAAIGVLGGLIGLGGAEFRLPLLIGLFGFKALEAIVLNKATSLIVVTAALVFRSGTIAPELIVSHWAVIANLLAGSLIGAWLGADWATRMKSATLYKVIAILLVAIAIVLLLGHATATSQVTALEGWPLYIAARGLATLHRRGTRRPSDRNRRIADGRGGR
jgi:uncharacterized protein